MLCLLLQAAGWNTPVWNAYLHSRRIHEPSSWQLFLRFGQGMQQALLHRDLESWADIPTEFVLKNVRPLVVVPQEERRSSRRLAEAAVTVPPSPAAAAAPRDPRRVAFQVPHDRQLARVKPAALANIPERKKSIAGKAAMTSTAVLSSIVISLDDVMDDNMRHTVHAMSHAIRFSQRCYKESLEVKRIVVNCRGGGVMAMAFTLKEVLARIILQCLPTYLHVVQARR